MQEMNQQILDTLAREAFYGYYRDSLINILKILKINMLVILILIMITLEMQFTYFRDATYDNHKWILCSIASRLLSSYERNSIV